MQDIATSPATDRPYHHGNLREAILAAALDVLERDAPSALSLRDLARTVGVRHSALYAHFRDRSDLLAVIAGEGFKALFREMESAPPSPAGRVAALAEVYVRFARQNPSYYKVMFLPEVSRPEDSSRFKETCEACFGTLMNALRELPGLPETEIHERAIGIWSTLHGFVLLGDDSGPLHRQISPDAELQVASRIVQALTQGDWPQNEDPRA